MIKVATNLYTVTIEDEYLNENYFVKEYADYYTNEYEKIVAEALKSDGGACSGSRNGNYAGRTYDWYYVGLPTRDFHFIKY